MFANERKRSALLSLTFFPFYVVPEQGDLTFL
jgi:hypothetical protein